MTQYRALFLFIVTLAFGAAPFLSEPFRGYPAGSFPVDILRPSIQPAGYAFSIWGLIYLWLLAHAVFGLLKRRNDPAFLRPALPLRMADLFDRPERVTRVPNDLSALEALIQERRRV